MRRLGWTALALCLLLLPLGAAAGLPAALPGDGLYTVEVALAGGTGRASVASPAELAVENGAARATVVWSSPYYEYMVVGEETYYPVQEEGNSTFVIPVALDVDMAVSAQTAAMSQPHVIAYTLRFDSATLKPIQEGGGRGSMLLWGAAAAAAVLTGLMRMMAKNARSNKRTAKEPKP